MKYQERLELARNRLATVSRFETYEGQCEVAKMLRDDYKITRDDIGILLGLTSRQVKTRLSAGILNCVAKGLIPSAEFKQKLGVSQVAVEVMSDELEKYENLALLREAKNVLKTTHFSDKLASAIGSQLPNEAQLELVNEMWAAEKREHDERLTVYCAEPTTNSVAMVTQSDAHFFQNGASFNTNMAHIANHNYYTQVFDRVYKQRAHTKIDTLHMNLLGDNMQGTANYDNQRWDADRCAIDQAEALTQIYVENILRSLMHFENIVVNGVPGNHGKISAKSSEPDHSNWETVVLRSLQWAFRNNSRVKFNLTNDWYQVIEANGQKFMLTHGHAMPGAGNYDNVVSTVRKWQDTLEYFDYVVIGHFHRLAKLPLTRNKNNPKHRFVFMNGCYPTEDSYIEKFGASHTNLQWLFFIGEAGITDAVDIELYGDIHGNQSQVA